MEIEAHFPYDIKMRSPELSGTKGLYIYQSQERGNRLLPSSSSRNYWILTLLRDKLKQVVDSDLVSPGEKLLDFGCAEKPYQSLFSKKFSRYVGADLAGNPEADLILSRDGRVPSQAEAFDCVLSSQVLEHVEHPKVYLGEAHRVLKTGRCLILSTHGIWPYHPDPIDFWRWTGAGLQHEIRTAGFEILLVRGVFGPESSALQLWQDSTCDRLPGLFRPVYTRLTQAAIGFIERRRGKSEAQDAAVYIVLARKSHSAEASS